MILDLENMLSDDQVITVTADSTNIIEMPKNRAHGRPLRLIFLVTETFVGGTSVAIDLETDALAAFGSPADIYTGAAIVTASLIAGYRFGIDFLPRANEEFLRAEYTIVGTFTEGKITAGFLYDDQSNKNTFPS